MILWPEVRFESVSRNSCQSYVLLFNVQFGSQSRRCHCRGEVNFSPLELVWKLDAKVIFGHLECYYLWDLYRTHYPFAWSPLGFRRVGFRRFYTPSRSLSHSLFARLIPAGALEAGEISIALVIYSLDRYAHPTSALVKTLVLRQIVLQKWISKQALRIYVLRF